MQQFTSDQLQTLDAKSSSLAQRIQEKKSVIGIVGLGYVGLPIAFEFCQKGFQCIGIDVSERVVNNLNQGINHIEDLDDEAVAAIVEKGLFRASTDYEDLAEVDIIYICVPTPFNENKDPDISYILSAGKGVSEILTAGKLIILKSTTFPGTTQEYLIPELDKSGLQAGRDYYVAFSPERVDPGNKVFHTGNTPIVTGGIDKTSTILASLTNNQIVNEVYMVDNPKVAELEKLLENIFRSVNIALVNELALLCERMGGVNVWEVINAAGTKPFGYMKFTPGPGVGGHCIPIDPYYLSWLAREYDFETKFITLAANVNESMPYHVANKVVRQIAKQPISLSEAKVLIVGVSFKRNVKDLRHSPAESIMHRLLEEGITNIEYVDPWAPEYQVAGKTYYSIDLSEEALASYHSTILITDHDDFDIPFIVKHSNHVVDTRNMTAGIEEGQDKIDLLGYQAPRKKYELQH